MKKNLFTLSALCLAAMTLVFSGCQKENNDPQEPAQVQTYQMSIQASKGTDSQANGPRRVLSLDGNTLNATWAENEEVTVYNTTKGAAMGGTLKAQTSGASTQLKGELTGTIEAGDKLTLKFLAPSYAEQEGTLAYISANCDYAIATDVEVTDIVDGTIYTDGETTFENQQAVVEFNLKDNSNNAISASELVVKVGTATSYTVTLTPAASKLYVAIPGFAGETVTLTATVGSDTYTYEKAGATFANGNFYQITAKLTKQAPEGAINGNFSVSPTLKVYFSKGNLKYTKSTGKFEFMTNQYDMAETNNQNVGNDYANQEVISIFGWATSNINNSPANTYYYPWETDNSSGSNAKYGSGITTANVSWSDNNNAFANYDWGKNMGDGWRTLTAEEWGYLIGLGNGGPTPSEYRDHYQSLRGLCKITVSGTEYPGMIILPDDLYNNLPTATEGDIATKWAACAVAAGSLTYNTTFTEKEWTALQEAGAVFLPAAGYRNGTTVLFVGTGGYYWSSTSESSPLAFYLYFGPNKLKPGNNSQRCNGNSVRLVHDVK